MCPHGKYQTDLGGAQLRNSDGIHFSVAPGTGGQLLAPLLLPRWEDLSHLQEASGGHVVTSPLPAHVSPP